MNDIRTSEQEDWWRSPGYVYFIAAGDPPAAIKIGVTKMDKLKDRIREHQSSNHETLSFLGVLPFLDSEYPMKDAEIHEQKLHNKFVKFQRRKGAGHEWFTANPELIEFIERNATPVSEGDVNVSRDLTSNFPPDQFSDYSEFWGKFLNDKNIADVKAAISLHDALVFPGYITVLKGTLQFRLIERPDKIVMSIHTDGRMEIYLDHPNKQMIETLIKKHVTLDKIQSYSGEKKFLFLNWNDWKEHISEFMTAYEQINKEYQRNQEVEKIKSNIV